jgi:hypothetical protein
MATSGTRFNNFYHNVFLAEHRHRANVVMHVFGTVASAVWVVMSVLGSQPVWALLYPVVHAAPGLLGHRLFERNKELGDVRVTRSDYSPLWFIVANHRLTWELLVRALRGGRSA